MIYFKILQHLSSHLRGNSDKLLIVSVPPSGVGVPSRRAGGSEAFWAEAATTVDHFLLMTTG